VQQHAQGSGQGEQETVERTANNGGTGQVCHTPFKLRPEQGVCSGYSTTTITVYFEPASVAEFEEDIEVVCAVKWKATALATPDIFRVHLQV
jgi:hypothetical protein